MRTAGAASRPLRSVELSCQLAQPERRCHDGRYEREPHLPGRIPPPRRPVTSTTLIWSNLWRNRLRTALTLASVAMSLFLFTMLRAVVESMQAVAASSADQLRLVVHQRSTMTKLLPLGYGAKIAALPGAKAVCAVRWFGGRVANSAEQFPSLAGQYETVPEVYADFNLSPAEIAAWRTDRQAAFVGAGLAHRMGWSRGQRVTLRGGTPPYPTLEFHIVGITAAPAYPNLFALRLDYLVEALRAGPAMPPDYYDAVNFFWVKATTPAALDALRGQIDDLFANSPERTRTEQEESFVANFTKMFGDIPRIVGSVGLVVLATILLVVGNTMSMSIRERAGELAVLKAIGFPPWRILATVLGESMLLGLIGGLAGCIAALLAAGSTVGRGLNMPYFPTIQVTPATVALGIGAGVLVGALAGLPPARQVTRQAVTATLRAAG
jgi:putative ABC transport system permease protein